MTTTKRLSLAMCFASAGALWMAHTGSAQSADPWVGAWTLNLSKSTVSPGPPNRRNALKIETVAGGAQKHTFDGLDAQGQPFHSERVATFDGADVMVQAIAPATKVVRTNAFRRLGSHSFEVVAKVDGNVVSTSQIVVSSDGKTLTETTTGVNRQGQAVKSVSIYEK